MYKVVLVDDELWALKGIKKIFPWEEYDFEVIAESTDGKEAIGIIMNNDVDVVFTDIKMSDFSGIDLMTEVQRRKKIKFVIISAYRNFEYAQKTMELGACAYLLKPIIHEDAKKLLVKLKGMLDEERGIVAVDDLFEKFGMENINIDNAKFSRILNYIINNIDMKLNLDDIASKFGMNGSYCSTLFKRYFDCGFSDFLAGIRIKKACEMIKDSDLSIGEIAEKCGYYDYYYFNKVFKKVLGVTPNEYRKQVKKGE